MAIIYSLSDPSTGEIRYIGKTYGPLAKRLREHVYSAARPDMKQRLLASWIRSLGGERPIIEALETGPLDGLNYAEKRWIAIGRYCGLRLTNMTDGGDGQSPSYKPSAETRAKTSASLTGRVKSDLERQHISEAQMGHTISEKTRQKIGDSNRGKVRTEEVRAAISARISGEGNPFFGKTHTEEAKARMDRTGMTHTPEAKVKISEAGIGRWHTEEEKELIRLRRQVGIEARLAAGLPAKGVGKLSEERKAQLRAAYYRSKTRATIMGEDLP